MGTMPRLHQDDIKEISDGVSKNVLSGIKDLVAKEQTTNKGITVSVKEAAVMLNGMNEQTISNYCKLGIIKAKKPGKSWLIPLSSIQKYLESKD